MKKIALAAAAILAVTGASFAGSDHYGSEAVNNPPVSTNVDSGYTASVNAGSNGYVVKSNTAAEQRLGGNS
jgi:hypothetical protein